MSRDRLAVCKHYVSKGHCDLGKCAEQNGLCQTCKQYTQRKGSKKIVRELRRKFKEKKYKERYGD